MDKKKTVLQMIPKDVKTILDIGSEHNLYKDYKTTTLDFLQEADIKQDLNINQKLPFKDNSFDMVVMNQILEHLVNADELISEAKRVSKRYIFVGLPNELTLRARLKFIIGRPDWSGYKPYWHKHFFTIEKIEDFILKFFKNYKEKFYWCSIREKLFTYNVQKVLVNKRPTLFCKEVYYLIEK